MSSGRRYSYLYDGKGNVVTVLNNLQTEVAKYRYDSFGSLVASSGTLNQAYRFSTKRYLSGYGVSYFGYRFYVAHMGRWINRDPIGEEGGVNLYGMVGNSVMNFVDPWGLVASNFGPMNTDSSEYYGLWLDMNHRYPDMPIPTYQGVPINSADYLLNYEMNRKYDKNAPEPTQCTSGGFSRCMTKCFWENMFAISEDEVRQSAMKHGLNLAANEVNSSLLSKILGYSAKIIEKVGKYFIVLDLYNFKTCGENCYRDYKK